MRRHLVTRLAAVAGLLAAGAAVAQDNRPAAYLHAADKDGTWETREKGLNLRPNTELPFYAYVRNPAADPFPKGVTVTLSRDPDGKQPVARGTLASIAGGASVRVPLALVAPPAPPPPPPAKPGDPAPAPAAPAAAVPDKLYLHTETAGEDGVLKAPVQELDLVVSPPANYIEAVRQSTFKQLPSGDWEITVTLLGGRKDANGTLVPFPGPPAKVKLDVRPALSPGLDDTAPKAGTYESEVPAGSPGVVLSATNLKFKDKPAGRFAVSIDGWDRALVYDIGPEGNNGTPLGTSFALLALPAYHVTGKPLPVRVELFQEARGARPKLDFQRAKEGEPQHLTATAPATRQTATELRAGQAGELVFKSVVSDLVVTVDTNGVYGPRTFSLTSVPDGPPPFTKEVVFDATPPAVRLETPPPSKYVGTQLQVFAVVTDDESGVRPEDVLFFLGDPPGPDGKLPPASEGLKGTLVPTPKGGKAAPGRYTATFPLPDAKGKVKVGVRAVNGAGLVTTTETVTVLVVDPPPPPEKAGEKDKKPKRAVGDIKVKVIQGSTPERPQPGLPVELRNAAGGVVKAATTDAKGEAVFKDLPPGAYLVSSIKLADYGAKGFASVTVEEDKQSEATIEIKR